MCGRDDPTQYDRPRATAPDHFPGPSVEYVTRAANAQHAVAAMTPDRAVGIVVEARFLTLWAHRAWFRSHLGWIPQERTDERAELRYLIGLMKQARDLAQAETVWRYGPVAVGL